jgi:hypothetical protein
LNRRIPINGLLAVLLALMVQLGVGASVPDVRIGAVALGTICHVPDSDSGQGDTPTPHLADCQICPLCAAVHAPPLIMLARAAVLLPPGAQVILRRELPPPSTAPPALHRPPSQPRAPPVLS